MSGHSKWSTIKRKKEATDAQRSSKFTKIVREITVAAKQGTDIDSNPRLRLAVQNAKNINMPKDNIERAINKARSDEIIYTDIIYEGNLCGGAFIIECLTDKSTRTVAEIRSIFTKNGGSIGKNGSVGHCFEKKSFFKLKKNNIENAEDFLLNMIEFGGEDIDVDDTEDCLYFIGSDKRFGDLQKEIEKKGVKILESKLGYFPISTVEIDKEYKEKIIKFIETLEENDDVQHVYHNFLFN